MTDPGSRINYPGQPLTSVNVPNVVRLASGAVWLVPDGSFILNVPSQCALQWLDSNSGLWHTLEAAWTNHPIPVSSDGTNYRVINLSGTILGANITTAGTVYTQAGTTIAFAAPVTGGITATATPIIGGSLSFTVVTAGTLYTNPQFIIPAPQLLGGTPGFCIGASAVAVLSTGGFSSLTVHFAGAGYITAPGNVNSSTTITQTITPAQYQANPQYWLSQPNLVIVDPTGSGAYITSAITNGTPVSGGLTGMVMTNNGSLYDGTHIPAITITCTGSSGTAAATALPSMALTSVTVAGTNTGYSGTPIGISSLGVVNPVFGEPALPRPARVTFGLSAGIINSTVIEDAGSGFQTVPAIGQLVNAGSNATFTAVVGGTTNTLLYWQVG
jgi:hypothetical protein